MSTQKLIFDKLKVHHSCAPSAPILYMYWEYMMLFFMLAIDVFGAKFKVFVPLRNPIVVQHPEKVTFSGLTEETH